MKMKRQVITIIAVIMLLSVMLGACSNQAKPESTPKATDAGQPSATDDSDMIGNMYKQGYPVVKDKVTLKIAAMRSPAHTKPFDELKYVQALEELTNVHIDWQEVAQGSWDEKKNLMLVGGNLPDAFMLGITKDDEMTYGEQEVFIPLENLIDEWAPGIKAIFEANPEVRPFVTTPNGHIYSLPTFSMIGIGNNADNMFINKVWLDKLNLKVPETTEEYYNTLKAFKDQDANGNGKPDEIGLSFVYGGWEALNYYSLFGSFGRLDNVDHMVLEDEQVVFTADKEEYKNAIKYFSKLYGEDLMDEEIFTQKGAQLKAKGTSEDVQLGSFIGFWRQNALNPDRVDDFVVLPPLAGPNGDRMWNRYEKDVKRGGFTITSANTMPEITMRWIDTIADQEISMSSLYGPKGYGWDDNADGTIELICPEGVSFDEHKHSESLANSGIKMVTRDTIDKFSYKEGDPTKQKLDDQQYYAPFFPQDILPDMYFTAEQQEELAVLATDILTYVDKKTAEWIDNGKIDAEWDEYINRLNSMGLEKYIQIYNDAYATYKANK